MLLTGMDIELFELLSFMLLLLCVFIMRNVVMCNVLCMHTSVSCSEHAHSVVMSLCHVIFYFLYLYVFKVCALPVLSVVVL